MNLKDKLEIMLVTYNRAENLSETLESLLAENSPVKEFNIKIFDNNSTDDTYNVVKSFMQNHPNIKYEKNKYNIGGNANITKAFYEAKKEYVWILADNDHYYWESWGEVENAIEHNMDAIVVSNYAFPKYDVSQLFCQATFLPSTIYKTSNITDNVMGNMTYSIHNLFPHIALFSNLINYNKSIYIVENSIVTIGDNRDKITKKHSYIRGYEDNDLHELQRDMSWATGYADSLYMIKDKNIRNYIATHRYNQVSLNSINRLFKTKNLYNTLSIFCVLSPYERFWCILKFLYYITFYKIFHINAQYKRYEDMTYERKLKLKFLFFTMTLRKEKLDPNKIGNKKFAYKNLFTKNTL